MKSNLAGLVLLLSLAVQTAGFAQNTQLAEASQAYADSDYPRALTLARQAMTAGLDANERAEAYEVIGYSLGLLGDASGAMQALESLIFLDPGRAPDTRTLPPRVVALYTQAYAQVLVVHRVLIDSTSFVAGNGQVTMHYQVSMPARVRVQIFGENVDAVLDSQTINPGEQRFDWDGMVGGQPIPAGTYEVNVSVGDDRNTYEASGALRVGHSVVDTVAHTDRLEGFDVVPDTRQPPRDWRPLGISALLTGLASGAALSIGDADLSGSRREMIGINVAALGVGLILSLRQPDPVPIPEAIALNSLIRVQIAAENQRRAEQNAETRRRVRLNFRQLVTR
jgi:hypothetical protein